MKGQFIYKIINTINNKFYVGSTTNTVERFRTHRNRLRGNRHHCRHLQAAWNQYGEQAFVFHVIETIPKEQSLQEAEDKWLQEHVGKEHCYNHGLRSGAPWRGAPKESHPRFGQPRSKDERQLISKKLKEFYAKDITNHPRFGKQHSSEAKAKISAKVRAAVERGGSGKFIPSEETRRKMSEALKGNQCAKGYKRTDAEREAIRQRTLGNQHWLGRKHTDESRKKMGKEVKALLPDGTIQTFITMNDAAQKLGVFLPTIIHACKSGKPISKGALAGWVLAYADQELRVPESPHIPDEYKHLPRSRSQAKAEGAKEYFTGLPCTHGHIAPRKTKGTCTACLKNHCA